jgi:hypothetical protein
VVAGMSVRSALRWINTRTLTSGGRPWTGRGLKQALQAYRMAGYVEKNGELYEAVWEPVYAETREEALEVVEALRAAFRENLDEHGYYGQDRKYLLTGRAECSDCHAPNPQEPNGGTCAGNVLTCKVPHRRFSHKPINHTDYYYCPSCYRGRTMANFDAYVDGRVLRLLNSKAFLRQLEAQAAAAEARQPNHAVEINALRTRRKQTETQLRTLADHPNLDPGVLADALASFDTKIKALEAKVGAGRRQGLLGRLAGISHEAWQAEDITVRSEAVGMLFRIIVYRTSQRGPGFDPSTIKLIRRKTEDGGARPADGPPALVSVG